MSLVNYKAQNHPHDPGCLAEYPLGCLGIECGCPCHIPIAESDRPQRCDPEDHDWVFDGYFWHVCDICGEVS